MKEKSKEDVSKLSETEMMKLIHELIMENEALKRFSTLQPGKPTAAIVSMLTHAISSISECVSISDTSDNIVFVNTAFLKCFQYEEHELIGNSIDIIRSSNNPPAIVNEILPATLSGGWQGELLNRKKDGSEFPIFLSTSVIHNENNEPIALIGVATDISERRQKEILQQDTLDRLLKISSQLPGMVYQYRLRPDGSSCFPYASEAIREIYSVSPEDVREDGTAVFNNIHPDDLAAVVASIQVSAKDLLPWQHEYRVKFKDGNVRFLYGNALPQMEKDGSVLWHGFITDISDRKRSEEALLESEARFNFLADTAPVLIWKSGTDALCDYFNQPWLDFTGRSLEQEMGNGWTDGVHPDDFQNCLDIYLDSFKAQRSFRMEYRLRHADGSYRWLLDNGIPRFTPDGIFAGYIGSCIDITANKVVEEKLLSLSLAVQQSPVSIVITDIQGNIEYGNPIVSELSGYDAVELIGENPRIFSSREKSREEYKQLWDTILSGNEWKGEFHNKKKNGELYWELASISPIKNKKGEIAHFLAVKEDITERKRVEEALIQSEKKYKEVVQNLKEVIFQTDANGLWLFLNYAWEEISGFSVEESLGQLFVNYVHPDDRQRNMELFEPLILRKKEYCRHQVRYLTKDGGFRWIEVYARLGLNEKDEITGTYGTLQDITERKLSEEALKSAHKSLSDILQAAIHTSIIATDVKGIITVFSKGSEEMLGYSAEEMIGKHTPARFHLESEVAERSLELSHEFGKPIDGFDVFVAKAQIQDSEERTWTYLHKSGKSIFVNLIVSVIRNQDQEIIGYLGIASDITERKLAEDEIEESREKYRGLSEAAFDSIFFSEKGRCIEQNLAGEKIFGYSTEEALSRYGTEWIVPEDRDMVMKNMLAGYEEPYEVMALKKDGSTFPCVLRGKMMHYKGRDVRVTSLTDISDRKQAEEKVKQVSARLELATRAGGVGVWEYDVSKNALLWDNQMFALYGIEEKNFGGVYETWRDGIHPDDEQRGDDEIQMALKGEKEFDTEFRVVWPDGSIHNIRAMAIVQRDESGNPLNMIGTNWDITKQKQNEKELLETNLYLESVTAKANEMAEMAETANKAKSVFLANMSHEIRTPLNAIIGFSQLMNRDQLLTDSQREYNFSIIRAGEHLLSLINDILELSKMEAGHLELNPSHVDLYALFSDIQMLFKESAQLKNLQFIFETADDLPRYIFVDDNKLRRIFINLIGNAIKFTDEGGIAVRIRGEKINEESSRLIVEIQDSGSGIAENEISKLFKQFEQTSSGIKKSSGTGLGLALSREMAILMGGGISVSSKIGIGSVFTFYVEIKEGKPIDIQEKLTKRVVSLKNAQQPVRVLVVDDKLENLQVVVNLLKITGFETNEAMDGAEAIEKFEAWNPHLILMDLRMPVMDGYEACRRIKLSEKGKKTAIIALTASVFKEEREKIASMDMQGYIQKPFRENELFSTIANILGIQYIYKDEAPMEHDKYLNDKKNITDDIAKLPLQLVLEMLDALAIADLDLLIELINSIEPENSELHHQLLGFANNYDYISLQKLLTNKK